MGGGSGGYGRRFGCWEFWVALAAVIFDVVVFAVPLFALLFLLALLQPQGWRWIARIAEALRRIEEG